MLWVYVYRYGAYPGGCRQTTFKASRFTYWIAEDGRSGTLTLHPDAVILTVGNDPEDYHCVRVFAHTHVVGTMCRSATGEVSWRSGEPPERG